MKKILAILLLLTLLPAGLAFGAEVSRDKRAEIERMLKLTGVEKSITNSMDQFLTQLQKEVEQQYPATPVAFWAKLKAKMDVRDLIEQMVPVYDQHYSLDELKALNSFYASPLGQKVLDTGPQVTSDCAKAVTAWGQKVTQQVVDELGKAKKK